MMVAGALDGFFQVAYITNDFEQGLEFLGRELGVPDFWVNRRVTVENAGGQSIVMSFALAWTGDIMVELIEAHEGDADFYRDGLAADRFDIKFHHYGMRASSAEAYDAVFSAHVTADHPIVFDGLFLSRQSRFFYTRSKLGHYLEYIWLTEVDHGFFDQVPGK